MTDRPSSLTRTRALVVAVTVPLIGACGGDPSVITLSEVCGSGYSSSANSAACYVRFDADIDSGVADGVLAAHLGPQGGELHIALNRLYAATEPTWNLDVLAASTVSEGSVLIRAITWGSCGGGCPPEPNNVEVTLSDGFDWAQVVVKQEGADTTVPDSAELVFSGANIDIVALRTPGYDNHYYY
jgi:hypothetical protein